MRRIFTHKPDSSRASLEQAALKQLRETRAKIKESHPDLLNVIRDEILARQTMPQTSQKATEAIDKQKNIETILKFLKQKDANPAMDLAIRAILETY